MSIPKIIHLVEPSHNVLSVWQNLHPDWQCIEWTIEGCYAFIKRYYPDAEATYLSFTTNAQRIHYSWYYLLHRYGGVVVEGNRVPKKKIEGLFLSLYDLYFIEDWFIASTAGTEFLSSAIETLPTLEPKWYNKYMGERSLMRSTATVLPEEAFKKHTKRVYQNYFHPLSSRGFGIFRIAVIGVLLVLCFQLSRMVLTKDRLQRLVKSYTGTLISNTAGESFDTAGESFNTAGEPFDTVSLQSLEKTLNLPPMIRIPPLQPDTPSSITSSLVISPLSDMSLVITPIREER